MRVLVVGCGYVGLPLCLELAKRGHDVFGLRRSAESDEVMLQRGVRPLHADITNPESLQKLPRDFDWVVNCSATGGGDVEAYRRLYLEGTGHLIGWLARKTLRRFVYTSSTGVYGQNDGSLVDETSPTAPATATAKVLVETEQLLKAAFRESAFPAVILRAAGIYGPDRGYLLKQFLEGDARIEGTGGRILNMVHRDDLVGIIIAALEKARPGEAYNAADDEPVSQLDFFAWLARTLRRPVPQTMLTQADAPRKRGLTSKRVGNKKLRRELQYVFRHPNFRSGYMEEIRRLTEQGALER